MNSKLGNSFASTTSSVVIGFLASSAFAQQEYLVGPLRLQQPPALVHHYDEFRPTSGGFANILLYEPSVAEVAKAELEAAYSSFTQSQIELEPDFATVLHDNLWDLYAR